MRGYLGAVPLYAADNRGRLPTSTYRDPDNPDTATNVVEVRVTLAPYTLSIPADTASWRVFSLTQDSMCPVEGWIYGFNSYVSKLPLAQIQQPSKLAYIIDEKSRWINSTTISSSTGLADLRTAVPKPHNGKITVGFLDGHVEQCFVSQMTVAQFTRGTSSYQSNHDTLHFASAEYDQ
jgi:prepilin-type processing-associated H-X9-DG protein